MDAASQKAPLHTYQLPTELRANRLRKSIATYIFFKAVTTCYFIQRTTLHSATFLVKGGQSATIVSSFFNS